jgi:hypothetical protein
MRMLLPGRYHCVLVSSTRRGCDWLEGQSRAAWRRQLREQRAKRRHRRADPGAAQPGMHSDCSANSLQYNPCT